MNLRTGMAASVLSTLNGQAPFGADVISRISHGMNGPDSIRELQAAVVSTMNGIMSALYAETGVSPERTYEAVVVGNATMLHLLFGIDPSPLAVMPFTPAFMEPLSVLASDIGLDIHPHGYIQTLPALGAYVGADIVAGVLATGIVREDKMRVFVDVGTNGEIVLGNGQRALATAAPAGPAFEGSQIRCGMRATDGAIEGVQLGDTVELQVIGGDVRPEGICGSGLVDAVAQLLLAGLLDHSGRMKTAEDVPGHPLRDRLIDVDGVRAFLLADGVYLTQKDIRELQFAKGSIATGIKVLMDILGIETKDLDEVLLGRFLRLVLEPGERQDHRPGASRRCRPDHRGRQLRRRGGEDRAALVSGASGRLRAAFPDRVRRAFRADGLQRRVRLGARLPTPGARRMNRTALVMCGALGKEIKDIVDRRGWDVDIYGVSALLHLYPSRIVDELRVKLHDLRPRYEKLVVVYGDCGTTGKLEPLLEEVGASRLRGPHCYEMFAGEERFRRVSEEKPGTFFLTDWLVRNFDRAVVRGLGLDRDPGAEDDGVRQLRGADVPQAGAESPTRREGGEDRGIPRPSARDRRRRPGGAGGSAR